MKYTRYTGTPECMSTTGMLSDATTRTSSIITGILARSSPRLPWIYHFAYRYR